LIRAIFIAILGAALVAVALAAPAYAGERAEPQRSELDSYCSPTGDYCLGIEYQHKRVKLQIVSQAFTGDYTLCVKGPSSRECIGFSLERIDANYADSVDWKRRFGYQGPGTYLVQWKVGGSVLGKTLGFKFG
jgi:hypothetical protein